MIRVAGVIATGLAVLVVVKHLAPWRSLRQPLHCNLIASQPRGLYRAELREGVRRGDIRRVHPMARGYAGPSFCP